MGSTYFKCFIKKPPGFGIKEEGEEEGDEEEEEETHSKEKGVSQEENGEEREEVEDQKERFHPRENGFLCPWLYTRALGVLKGKTFNEVLKIPLWH
jgi:hypothetical protein